MAAGATAKKNLRLWSYSRHHNRWRLQLLQKRSALLSSLLLQKAFALGIELCL